MRRAAAVGIQVAGAVPRIVEPAGAEVFVPRDEIQVRGNQPATYYVEVRGGDARLALRNGKPLTQRRTFSTWSVPGMFATMSRDVDALERRAAGQADASTPDLNLRATFGPRYGYPARYRRLQYRSSVEVEWEVTRFEVVPSERGASAP